MVATPIVALTDTVFPDLDPAKKALKAANAELIQAKENTPDAILEVARDADGLLVTYGKITADIIGQLKNCKVIGRFGIGVDNIDIEAATKAGIVVTYVPDYCFDEVSDQAMAMLLSLARKVTLANGVVQSGRWEMPAVVPISRIRGSTLGLVGFGHIPQLMAPKAQAFGMDVIISDPYVSDDIVKKCGVKKVEFDQLLEQSDFISIHAPLTPETQNLFSSDVFKKMKSTAYLINTARGPLVDADALVKALDAGEIAGAALDVVPVEPLPKDSPLLGRDNLILTPHTAFYSEDALLDLQTKCAIDVASVLNGNKPKYPVNPEALK
ncbi:MAG: C-terminal binding protein [Rhodospirillales bacterium]|nr:C-terminal binding protein [Rhodospirillales bacterium]